MSDIVFSQISDTRQLELTIDGDSTWMAVTEEFVAFLQGCGYQVTGTDVADYLTEVYGITEYDPNEFVETTTQGNEDTHVSLNDVMNMWGQAAQVSRDANTITITTR